MVSVVSEGSVVDMSCHWKEIFFSREGEESSFASEGEDTT